MFSLVNLQLFYILIGSDRRTYKTGQQRGRQTDIQTYRRTG
jgi:hypothetical protein